MRGLMDGNILRAMQRWFCKCSHCGREDKKFLNVQFSLLAPHSHYDPMKRYSPPSESELYRGLRLELENQLHPAVFNYDMPREVTNY